MARPPSAEPLHGVDANAQLVATMGKHPEEEDAAIAQEWSPRGGRKMSIAREKSLTACTIEQHGLRSVNSRWKSSSSSLSSAEASGSCSPSSLRQQQRRSRARSLEARGRRRGDRNSLSKSPGGRGCNTRRPWQPIHDSSGHGASLSSSLGLPRRGERGRYDNVQNCLIATAAPFDDEVFSNSSDGQGDDSDELRFDCSPKLDALGRGSASDPQWDQGPFRGDASRGNLGGQFAILESPYRTYRAKHARLLRARSSERAEAETRRAVLEHLGGRGASRSRSADSVVRSERWRGTSGMTSPLLHREGFGLLQSKTTGKVSRIHSPSS